MPRLIVSRPAAHAQTAMLPEGPREQTPFDEMVALRQRITNGFRWLPAHLPDNEIGARQQTKYLARYNGMLGRFREQCTPQELEAMATAYAKRVDAVSDDAHDDATYLARLDEYLVAADLADQTLVSWMLDRVRFWEEAGK